MFDSAILDVAIGLAFLFCMISLAASTLRECVEGFLKTRAVMLERGIRELLCDPDNRTKIVAELFGHPAISGLFTGDYPALRAYRWKASLGQRIPLRSHLPSYIPSRTFALGLIDQIARGSVAAANAGAAAPAPDASPVDFDRLRGAVRDMIGNAGLQRSLLMRLDEADGDIERVRKSIETWYDNAMDRVSGWYRRETQAILFAIGLFAASLLNIDAVAIGQRLLVDKAWRESVVVAAGGVAASADTAGQASPPPIAKLEGTLSTQGFMIGAPLPSVSFKLPGLAKTDPSRFLGFVAAIPGYLIVALATSLGSSFWFDALNKMMVIRSTVKPHEKSGEEASKDKNDPTDPPTTTRDATGGSGSGSGGGAPAPTPDGPLTDDDHALLDIDPADRPREVDDA